MMIIYALVSLILGIWMLAMGLRGIITKKPFVFASKSNLWLIALSFSPMLIMAVKGFWESYQFSVKYNEPLESADYIFLSIPFVMYPLLFVFYRRILRGYGVIGITDESFRQAIYAVLNDLRLPFEERLSKLHLTTLNADLEVNVSGLMGTANVRVKQPEHQKTLEEIAAKLSEYFAGSHVEINLSTCVFYLIFGVIILASGAFLAFR